MERCRYLEASKCKGTCMNLCKLPTEAFFKEDLGMYLQVLDNKQERTKKNEDNAKGRRSK